VRPVEGGWHEMAIDPVCGMKVDESQAAATSEYQGKTFYFCAVACKRQFDEDPEEFLGQAEEEEESATQAAEGTRIEATNV
jgi:Cu+-exporting ATPase